MQQIPELRYQKQDCSLTLREGIAEFHRYLAALGREQMRDKGSSRLLLEHDATHVIFGMDTTLEQEAGLDTWLLFGCQYQLSYLRGYGKLPEIKAVYEALVSELGWSLFPRLYWKTLGLKWRVFRQTRKMTRKWPFRFPDEWLDRPVNELRAEHGLVILDVDQRETGVPLVWSGVY